MSPCLTFWRRPHRPCTEHHPFRLSDKYPHRSKTSCPTTRNNRSLITSPRCLAQIGRHTRVKNCIILHVPAASIPVRVEFAANVRHWHRLAAGGRPPRLSECPGAPVSDQTTRVRQPRDAPCISHELTRLLSGSSTSSLNTDFATHRYVKKRIKRCECLKPGSGSICAATSSSCAVAIDHVSTSPLRPASK